MPPNSIFNVPISHSFALTNVLNLLNFFVILLNYCVFADIDILYRKNICDEKEFFVPYVKLLRTRQPHHENFPILKLLNPGYLSVSKHSGILCINGPAIVYTDVVRNAQCSKHPSADLIPSAGEPQIFIHDCFSINRLPRDAYKEADQKELTKESEVFGNKVFGVYLLGTFPDYRLPNFVFFSRPDFGYVPQSSFCVNGGASVAFVANNSETSVHCYTVQKYNTEGVINVNYPGNSLFCFREDQELDFDSVWHKEKPLMIEDIVWRNGSSCNPSPQSIQADFDVEPFQLPDFRIVDPKFWNSRGSSGVIVKKKQNIGEVAEDSVYSQPNPPGSLFPGEPGWKDPSEWGGRQDVETTTSQPFQKYQVDISESECEEVPKVPTEDICKDEFSSEPCALLHHTLTLEATDWKSEDMKGGSWRVTILNLVTSIYEKACPQVAKFLSSALSRLYQYFLSIALKEDESLKTNFNGPQHQDWADLTKELAECNEKATMMNFFKKKDAAVIKSRYRLEQKMEKIHKNIAKRLESLSQQFKSGDGAGSSNNAQIGSTVVGLERNLEHIADIREIDKIQQHLNEMPLKFPYTILVGSPGKEGVSGATKVYQYREAAEVDHELDWVLDSFWKVISAVLGYCHLHFSTRDEATFEKMYQGFSRDFLEYITKYWIKGENRAIYEQIFGEFINGAGSLWLDACQNGAYQWSEIIDLRPFRPLHVNDGDAPPPHALNQGSPATPPNFYLDNPAFAANDHYDYYDDKGSAPIGAVDDTPEVYPLADSLLKNDNERKIAIAEAVVNLRTENAEDDPLPKLM